MSSGLRTPQHSEKQSVNQMLNREYRREKNLDSRQRELKVKMMKDKEEEKAKAEIEKMADDATLAQAEAAFHTVVSSSADTEA